MKIYKGAIHTIKIINKNDEYLFYSKIYYRLQWFRFITIKKEYNTATYSMKMVNQINKEIINNLNGLFRL